MRTWLAVCVCVGMLALARRGQAEPDPSEGQDARCWAELGDGELGSALFSCEAAARFGGTPLGRWGYVRARTLAPDPLSPREFSILARHAASAQRRAPEDVAGFAAECDLALDVGDRRLLESCAQQLQNIAPNHPETLRATRALAPSPLTLALWAGFLGLTIFTLFDAVRRSVRRLASKPGLARLAGSLLLLVPVTQLPARAGATDSVSEASLAAEPPGRQPIPVDENDPEGSVPGPEVASQAPLEYGYMVLELAGAADDAYQSGDYEAAARFYRAIVKAVPDRSVGYVKLCDAYAAMGKIDLALEACAGALRVEGGTAEDYAKYVKLKLGQERALSATDVAEVSDIVTHLRTEGADELIVESIECELGARISDTARLARCVPVVAAAAPDDPRTITYQWSLALLEGERELAERLVAKAKASSMKPEGIRYMEQAMTLARGPRPLRHWVVFGLAGTALLLGALTLFRRRPSSLRLEPRSEDGARGVP